MYKLMLVDDEKEITRGLLEVMPFEELGFTVVGQADNGLEGVHLCEKLNPDLIVTDIRMPLMDGLAMCREIHKSLPTAHFIILSGYDDFEYARQAMHFKSMDYLLKPISSTEFADALRLAKTKLDEEFALQRDIINLRANFTTSLPLLREMLLSTLLSGSVDITAARRDAPRYGLMLSAPQYALAVMRPIAVKQPLPEDLNDPELVKQAMINITRDTLADSFPTEVFHFDGMIAVLFFLPDVAESTFNRVQAALDVVRKTAIHFLEVSPVIGLGAPCFRLEDLHVCARQAVTALDYSVLQGGDTLCVTDLEPGSRTELVASETLLRILTNAIKMGNRLETHRSLSELMEVLVKPTPHNYRVYILEILLTLLRTARDMNADVDVLGDNSSTLECLMREPAIDKAEAILSELADRLLESIQSNLANVTANLARQAGDYLAQHYTEPEISVEHLCRELHVSPSYFSVLYKQEKKETFHQTLTRLRMDRAIMLLTSTDQKTLEIAASVGIPDPSYFSYAFKRHFGFSPSQTRSGKGGHTP
ncbi:MAG: response regulator [Eubacteriales bacterium]|nr:response regulator [Eubacteriales bacterium]